MSTKVNRTTVARADGSWVCVSTVDMYGRDADKMLVDGRTVSQVMQENLGYRYETMVFPCDEFGKISSYIDLDGARTPFTDITAAHNQHAVMVAKWSGS